VAELLLKDVEKVYPGGIRAVSRLNLQIDDGRFVVLVGPSGCGKSTTLRMVAGLEPPTGGSISIGGRAVDRLAPKDRNVAMVFQNHALYPHLTPRENMAFGLKMRRLPAEQIGRRIEEAARILKLETLLDRRPKTLSGGERQRVALGRAIVRKPDVFLFDEPLSNLDAALRGRMRVEIKRLQAELGITTFYVTHDQAEAMTLGERIAVMKDGLIRQAGRPMDVYQSPADTFVAGFIGTPAMNFFAGRIVRKEGHLVFEAGDRFELPVPADRSPALEAYADRPITLGIRPEHIGSSAAEQSETAGRIPSRVEAVEPMGAETYVHLSAGATRFVARAESGCQLMAGQDAAAAVLPEKAHFFDPETEEAVGCPFSQRQESSRCR